MRWSFGWIFLLKCIGAVDVERVPMRPSATLPAQLSWPNYNGVACAAAEGDDAYLFSSNSYAHASCGSLQRRVEAVRIDTSTGAAALRDPMVVYNNHGCTGHSISFRGFLPACRYQMQFEGGQRVLQNIRSVRVPHGRSARLFDSCYNHKSPYKTIVGNDQCVDLTASERTNLHMLVPDDCHARVLNRVVLADASFYDHYLQRGGVGGARVADNVVACKATPSEVLVFVNDFRRCRDVESGIIALGRDLSYRTFIPMPQCPHLRDAALLDNNTVMVACAGTTAGNSAEAELRRVNLATGAYDSYPLMMVYTNELTQYTTNVLVSPFKLVRLNDQYVLVLGIRWQDMAILTVASGAAKFGVDNYTNVTYVDTIGIPSAVSYDASNALLYMVSEHRLVAWDVVQKRIRERDSVCGTTALEFPELAVDSVHADPDHGFVYGINSYSHSSGPYIPSSAQITPPGLFEVRAAGLEMGVVYPFQLTPEQGFIHNVYPQYMGNGKYANVSYVYRANITVALRHAHAKARLLVASGMYSATPPYVAIAVLNGCATGKAGVEDEVCMPCAPGFHADVNGLTACKMCAVGQFSAEHESIRCAACGAGLYAPLPASTECAECAFGRFSNVQGAANCNLCPKDHYHLVRGSTRATDCIPCAEGEISDRGASSCTACPLGKRKTRVATCTVCPLGTYGGGGAASCADCPVGKFGTSNGSVVEETGCQWCPAGRVGTRPALKGQHQCNACPKGKYRPSSGEGTQLCKWCSPGYFSGLASPTCSECPAGWRTIGENRIECTRCAVGKYRIAGGDNACEHCPANTFGTQLAAQNASMCLPCAEGTQTFTTGSASASQCVPCSAGKVRSEGDAACTQCPPGRIAREEGLSACTSCPRGYYETNTRAECRSCAAGMYQTSVGGVSCAACLAGMYSPVPASPACIDCPTGYVAAGSFADMCDPCPTGYFKDVDGVGSCQECAPGSVSDVFASNTSSSCTACPAGWWASSSTACTSCFPGRYNSLQLQSTEQACRPCPAGTFGKKAGANSSDMCAPCNPGRFSEDVGSTSHESCLPCAEGTYRALPGAGSPLDCAECAAGQASGMGAAECSSCSAGTFSLGAVAECTTCPADRHATGEASVSCSACQDGAEPSLDRTACVCSVQRYSANGSAESECRECPEHAICDHTNVTLHALRLQKGYWRHAPDSLEIRRCPEPDACVGGAIVNATTDSMCRQGHTGPLCAVCVAGYAKTREGLCAQCPPERASLNLAVTVLAPLGLAAVVVVMVITANSDIHAADDNRFSAILKITSSMLQVYTVCSAFDVKWPSLLVTVFERSDALNPTLGFYSAQCSFGWSYFDRAYVYMAMPPVYVACSLLSTVVSSKCLARPGERGAFIRRWSQTATVVGLFLMYTAVLKSLFRGLACDYVGGKYYLSTDYSIQCYHGEHASFIVPAALCLVLYGAGIPLTAVALMWQWRFSLHEDGARALQFLHRGYRRERYFWEVVIVVRKVVVISMSIFMFTGDTMTRYQSPVASWFFVGCLILHLTCQPFDPLTEYGRVCNALEASAIAACICTLNAGIIFGTHTQNYTHGVFEGLILIFTILINGIVGVLFAYHIVRSGMDKGKQSCKKVLRVCCFRHPPPSDSQPRTRTRRHSIHKWVHGGEDFTEERKREIELEQRTPETAALDQRLKSQRSMKLKALHAEIESSQRRRMFRLDRDSERVHEALHNADPETAQAFRRDWTRHLQDLLERMQLTPVHSEVSASLASTNADSVSVQINSPRESGNIDETKTQEPHVVII